VDERSLVLAIRWKDATALLAGDIRRRAERRLLARARRLAPVGLLQASHHGSDRGNTAPFLAALRPRAAIASAGARNRFGHPHPATVIRYRDRGVALRVTGREGALTARTAGADWGIAPAR
jgi:competence protein ComEC